MTYCIATALQHRIFSVHYAPILPSTSRHHLPVYLSAKFREWGIIIILFLRFAHVWIPTPQLIHAIKRVHLQQQETRLIATDSLAMIYHARINAWSSCLVIKHKLKPTPSVHLNSTCQSLPCFTLIRITHQLLQLSSSSGLNNLKPLRHSLCDFLIFMRQQSQRKGHIVPLSLRFASR